MKIMKKILATLLATSLLSSLCFNVSAATEVKTTNGDIGYIGADATAQTLEYAYEAFVGKDSNGNDYDYGSFDARETNTTLSNGKSEYGMKGVFGWKVKTGASGVTAQTNTDSHSGKYAMQFTNPDTNAESILNLYPAIGGKGGDKYSGDITGLVPYANYQFVFWYKGSKTLKVHYHTVVENQDTEIVSSYTATDEWKQASINIMANASGIIKLWLDFGETVSTGQYVLLDDVAFYRCGVGTDGSINLFGDDGFESTVTGDFDFATEKANQMYIKDSAGNFTHFARSGDASDNGTTFTMGVSEEESHTGKKSLKIVSKEITSDYSLKLRPQYVYYNDTKLIPAKEGYYTLSFWVKGYYDIYGLNVYAGDDSGVEYKFSNFKDALENISETEWKQVTVRNIPVTDEDIYVDININLYGKNHLENGVTIEEIPPLYLDDIQLVRQENYVENGDFEDGEIGATSVNGFAYDSTFANNTIEITDDAIVGEKALKITQNANGEKAYGGAIYAEGMYAEGGALSDIPAGEYLVSIWTKGASKPYFQYGLDGTTKKRVRVGGNGDAWTLNAQKITVSDTVKPYVYFSFLPDPPYIDTSLYIDDIRYETVENALARIGGLLDDFDAKTATANEIEYLRQWVNYFKDNLGAEKIKAFRLSVGDVTNNGAFDSGDVSSIRDYLLGNKTGTDAAFDVNGDTYADIRDLVRAVSIPRV